MRCFRLLVLPLLVVLLGLQAGSAIASTYDPSLAARRGALARALVGPAVQLKAKARPPRRKLGLSGKKARFQPKLTAGAAAQHPHRRAQP